MGCSSSTQHGWLAASLLGMACSAGVLEGNGGGAFGSATAATTASQLDSSDGDGGGDEVHDASSSAGDDAPPGESTGAPASSGSSEGATAMCGNGIAEPGESCDGMDLAAASCADFGFDDGALACDHACDLITDACFTCGDGEVAIGETCDGSDLGGATCQSLGFGGGTLSCSADCQQIVDDACTPLPSCGDGMLNGGEQCDGAQLGAATCVTQGFDLGTLACTASCTYDTSACMDDLSDCGVQGDFCIFDENDPQSTCCPAGVGDNVFGLCDVFLCV